MLTTILAAAIAIEHLFFLVLEMFLWRSEMGRKVFRTTPAFAAESAPLAANQGLYNGFLAAGLIWSVTTGNPEFSRSLKEFFFACVTVAGVFGGFTVSRRIIVIQALPALVGLLAVLLSQ